MLCHQCGSPVSPADSTCQNCGADLKRTSRRLELRSDGLRRMTQQLRAIKDEERFFPPNEDVSGRFKLGELIGSGPLGEVYRAQDSLIDAEVAVKVFDPKLIADPRHQEQFLRVARTARTMTQTNVVRVHGGGVHKDHPWVSMQALEGLNLRKILKMRRQKGEQFTLAELEPIVSQITLAIQHVNREFPLGNLKPSNIIFLPDLIKVTDHYLFAAFDPQLFAERLTDSQYLAPELHTPADEADPRCDVYSLGVIIGEMLFGPNYTPGSPTSDIPQAAAVDALCRRATAFDPAERYASVEELSEDFVTLVDTGRLLHEAKGQGASVPPPAPLDTPTPPDIAKPLEDDIATREYKRDGAEDDPELGDLLETNEVHRDELPPPPAPPGAAPKPEREPTATAIKPKPASSGPGADDDSDFPLPLLLAGLVGLIAVVAIIFWMSGSKPSKRVEIGDSDQPVADASATPDAGAVAAADDAGVDAAATNPKLTQATKQADQVLLAARGQAVVAAKKAKPEAKQGGDATKKATEVAQADVASAKTTKKTTSSGATAAAKGAKAAQSAKKAQGSTATSANSGASAPQTKPSAGTKCKSGMVLVKSHKGNYCIDAYEYPGRGVKPRTHVSWFKAKQLCNAKGKRLCKLTEWKHACGGKYPYGHHWNPNKCNTVDEDEFERSLAPAGKFSSCRSWTGAHDMTGNVFEWTAEQRIAGGGFDSGPSVASCRYSSPKAPGSSSGNIGFRCCASPE